MPPPKLRLPLSGLFVCSGAQPTSLRIAGHPFPYFGSKCYTLKAFLVNSVLPFPPTHRGTHGGHCAPTTTQYPPPPPPRPQSFPLFPPSRKRPTPAFQGEFSVSPGPGPLKSLSRVKGTASYFATGGRCNFLLPGRVFGLWSLQGQAPTSVDFPRGNVSYLSKKQARAFFQGEHLLAPGPVPNKC